MNGKLWLLAIAALVPTAALASVSPCPVLTGASSSYASLGGCNTIITINANGTLSFAYPNLNPYDGNDDNYVGVVNNFGSFVSSLSLSGSTDIFGFDGDGIDGYGIAGNAVDLASYGPEAYGGPNVTFSGISFNAYSGTVNFLSPIASGGGTSYFSLEEAPSAGLSLAGTVTGTTPGVTPEPTSFVMLGTGMLSALGIARKKWMA